MENGTDFIACDMPSATRLTIQHTGGRGRA
jgi:hypothetical protein